MLSWIKMTFLKARNLYYIVRSVTQPLTPRCPAMAGAGAAAGAAGERPCFSVCVWLLKLGCRLSVI